MYIVHVAMYASDIASVLNHYPQSWDLSLSPEALRRSNGWGYLASLTLTLLEGHIGINKKYTELLREGQIRNFDGKNIWTQHCCIKMWTAHHVYMQDLQYMQDMQDMKGVLGQFESCISPPARLKHVVKIGAWICQSSHLHVFDT